MIDPKLKNLRGSNRRDFIRYATAMAAAVGVDRAGLLNYLSDSGGYALALEAGPKTCRSLHYIAGAGGLANFTQPFVIPAVATSQDAQNISYFAPGQATKQAGADKDWYLGPAGTTPFATKPEMSAFVAGTNQAHTQTPTAESGMNTLLASVAAIQSATPTLLPLIAVSPFPTSYVAPGAPAPTTVPNAAGLIGLFNSAASLALLSKPADAALHETYFKAFLGLNAVAGRTSVERSLNSSKVAVGLLAQNLSSKLTPSAAERASFGYQAGMPQPVVDLIDATITGLKAMGLGLTAMVTMPAFRDDPHGRFNNGNAEAKEYSTYIASLFDGLAAMAKGMPDPAGGTKSLWDSLVLTVHGDTFKDPFQRSGWGDNTPQGSSIVYLRSAGYIKTGWYGDMTNGAGTNPDTARGWDPQSGSAVAGKTSAQSMEDADAAVLYAIAKGDDRRVRDFVNFRLGSGVINAALL